MAHRISPIGGEHLRPAEIVRRLRAEFEYVDADADAGTEHVADMLRQFQRMNAPQELLDAHRTMLGHAVRVVVSNREEFDDDYLAFTVMPGQSPFISYCSGRQQVAAAPLLERVCKILHYRAEIV